MKFAGVATFMAEKLAGRVSEARELSERILGLALKFGQKLIISLYNCYTSQSKLEIEQCLKFLSAPGRLIKSKVSNSFGDFNTQVAIKELDIKIKFDILT
eukprot:snap_masked-scaffold_75-processed-gene-0.46-mRNA-1 protein AED:1.00 eAED:1.00 QI:0/-1/0/0/-1/1/1/0/99